MTTIPISLDEATILDGASRFKIVIFVILPLVYPGLVATATYGFLVAWSEYILALTLLTDDSENIAAKFGSVFGDETVQWGPLMQVVQSQSFLL